MATVHLVRQLAARLFVLHPHVVLAEPGPVVRPVGPNDRRHLVLIAPPARRHGLRPALPDRRETVDRVPLRIGEDDVDVPVDVHVDQPQAGVAALGVDDHRVRRQRELKPLPAAAFGAPTEHALLVGVSHDQLAHTIAVEVPQPHAAVAAVDARKHRPVDLQAAKTLRVFDPATAVEVPQAGRLLAPDQNAGHATAAQHAEPHAAFDQWNGKPGRGPLSRFGQPDASLPNRLVGHHHVHVAVVVDVEHADPVVPAGGVAQRMPAEKVLRQTVVDVAEVEKLHLTLPPGDRVIHQFDDLVVADPSAGVMGERVDALLEDGGVDGRLHVADRRGAVRPVEVVALPIVGNGRGKLPAEPSDHVRVRVVFHVVDEAPVPRHVLVEPVPAVLVDHQLARKPRVGGREQHEHRRVQPDEIAVGRGLVENLREEPGAHRIHRVAARHPKRHRTGHLAGPKQVDAPVVRRLGSGKIVAKKARARMVVRMGLDRHPFLQPSRKLRIAQVDARGHNAHRRPAVELLEPLEDRPKKLLISGRVAHVVDREHHGRLHARFADPLRRDQLGRIQAHVVRVRELVEVRQPIAVASRRHGAYQERENEQPLE